MNNSLLARLLVLLALTTVVSCPTIAQTTPSTPTRFRVDVPDGTSAELFVSWDTMSGADYYTLQRSTDGVHWATVSNCSGAPGLANTSVANGQVCRDNNSGQGFLVDDFTNYYYQIQACNSTANPQCSAWTAQSNYTVSMPAACNCGQAGADPVIPSVQGLKPHAPLRILTTDIIPCQTTCYEYTKNEFAGYANSSAATYRHTLLVALPGSGSTCSLSHFMYTAENLGFDTICVNYDNNKSQEDICQYTANTTDVAHCFDNISQTKLDFTGDCIQGKSNSIWNLANCGHDSSKYDPVNNPLGIYYVNLYWDAVIPRITSMLYYLCHNNLDLGNTQWEQYLIIPQGTCASATVDQVSPNWSRIIVGGFSQGGDMATFAAYKNSVSRVINLSAPPQATPNGNNVMTAAAYLSHFKDGTAMTPLRRVFGLVSVNDDHYSRGVYLAIWNQLGYLPSNDPEWRLNTRQFNALVTLNCQAGASHNLSNSALVNQTKTGTNGSGHDDPLEVWNEDIYIYMLLASTT